MADLAPSAARHAPKTQIEACAWVFHRDRLLIGHIASLDKDERALLQLHDRQGVATGAPLEQSREEMARWSRVRKPIFPVPQACTNLADVMLPDSDYGMCDAHLERVLATPRLLDAQAYSAFHGSKGYCRGQSVAMADLVDGLNAKYGQDVTDNPFALPLEDYLALTVRPRGSALAFLCDDYPLDLAVEDWMHAQARLQAIETALPVVAGVREMVRDRAYG